MKIAFLKQFKLTFIYKLYLHRTMRFYINRLLLSEKKLLTQKPGNLNSN